MIWDTISQELGLSVNFIKNASYKNYRYKTYFIGVKKRKIHHPSKELKVIQRWLIDNFFLIAPVSCYAMAYEKDSSNIKNARIHRKSNFLFQTDISSFFESITSKLVRELIISINNELSQEEIEFILRIVLYKGKLTVGSPSSPAIANRVMYRFDNSLVEKLQLYKEQNFIYTRYSDDITISSNQFINNSIIDLISNELSSLNMVINKKKTHFSSRSSRMMITGVNIDNNNREITIGTKKYKQIKKDVYMYLIKSIGDKEVIIGKLSYLKSVNKVQYEQILSIYSRYKNFESLINSKED